MDKTLSQIDTFVLPYGPLKFAGMAPFQQYSSKAQDYKGLKCSWVDRGLLGRAVRIVCEARNEVAYITPFGYEITALTVEPQASVSQSKRGPGRPKKVA